MFSNLIKLDLQPTSICFFFQKKKHSLKAVFINHCLLISLNETTLKQNRDKHIRMTLYTALSKPQGNWVLLFFRALKQYAIVLQALFIMWHTLQCETQRIGRQGLSGFSLKFSSKAITWKSILSRKTSYFRILK